MSYAAGREGEKWSVPGSNGCLLVSLAPRWACEPGGDLSTYSCVQRRQAASERPYLTTAFLRRRPRKREWGREDSNLRRLSRRVYSPLPLTARALPRENGILPANALDPRERPEIVVEAAATDTAGAAHLTPSSAPIRSPRATHGQPATKSRSRRDDRSEGAESRTQANTAERRRQLCRRTLGGESRSL
jgi:hypothetical protein